MYRYKPLTKLYERYCIVVMGCRQWNYYSLMIIVPLFIALGANYHYVFKSNRTNTRYTLTSGISYVGSQR